MSSLVPGGRWWWHSGGSGVVAPAACVPAGRWWWHSGVVSAVVVESTSLLNAIKNYWTDNGLATSIATLYAEGAPASADLPFIIIDDIAEIMPGETPDDKPVEMFCTVWASTASGARTLARSFEDVFGDASDATRAVPRDPFTWTTGQENFCERDESVPSMTAKPYKNGRVFRHRIHMRIWISGRP